MTPPKPLKPLGLAWMFVPVLASFAVSLVLAIAMHNPMSLLFGVLAPLMMVVPAVERIRHRRHERGLTAHERNARALRYPSIGSLARGSLVRVPSWDEASGNSNTLIRIGVDVSGDPVLIGADESVNVDDHPLADAVIRATCSSALWATGHIEAPERAGRNLPLARWHLALDNAGHARLTDRWGREVTRVVWPDLLSHSDEVRLRERIESLTGAAVIAGAEWDLTVEGPHALVSGVTGSGKTVLLLAWLRHMLAGDSSLAVVVFDFKGGGAFAKLGEHPAMRHIVTNLDDDVDAALDGLEALMIRRQRLLAQAGAIDLCEADPRPERILIVVDEFRALLDAHPRAAAVFADIAARGRALMIHLVLATQRFTGVASDALVANCALRIVLRCGEESEARALLGTTDTSAVLTLRAGEGFVSAPGQPVTRFRFTFDSPPFAVVASGAPEPLWLPPLTANPTWCSLRAAAGDVTGDEPALNRSLILGTCSDQVGLTRRPVLLPRSSGTLVIVQGARPQPREQFVRALAQQSAMSVMTGHPADVWDALGLSAESERGFALVNADAILATLAPAWRDEFVDLLIRSIHDSLSQGRLCLLSLGGGATALRNRLEQFGPEDMHLDEKTVLTGRWRESHFTAVFPSDQGTSDEPMPEQRNRAPLLPRDAILVTPFASSRQAGYTEQRVVTTEDWILGRVTRSPDTIVAVEGCSPHEARSLRLSAACIPPAKARTVVAVMPDGRWRRFAIES